MCVCSVAQSCPILQPPGLQLAGLLCPWGYSGKNTGVDCHFLLQGIFPAPGLNSWVLQWQLNYLPLSHREAHSLLVRHSLIYLKLFSRRLMPQETYEPIPRTGYRWSRVRSRWTYTPLGQISLRFSHVAKCLLDISTFCGSCPQTPAIHTRHFKLTFFSHTCPFSIFSFYEITITSPHHPSSKLPKQKTLETFLVFSFSSSHSCQSQLAPSLMHFHSTLLTCPQVLYNHS